MGRNLYDYHHSQRSITLNEAEKKMDSICKQIREFSNLIGHGGELVNYNGENIEEDFRHTVLSTFMGKLEDAYDIGIHPFKEIVNEGYLSKNSDGRYAFEDGDYLTSGNNCEVIHYDTFYEKDVWKTGRIEHDGLDYYHTGLGKGVNLDGKYARYRR